MSTPAVENPESALRDALSGERRQVTVLFYDIVGSTELLHTLDPEDFGLIQRSLHTEAVAVIQSCGGYVERLHGDGGCAYFGLPDPIEDAAECAVSAALEIVKRCERLQSERGPSLKVRVGVATGIVVIADTTGTALPGQGEVIGIAPAIAARIQSEAEPDTVVVADATYRLTHAAFEFQSLGTRRIKGVEEPIPLWRPSGRRLHIDRFSSSRRGSAPLVGREDELEACRGRWREACGGRGQIVLLQGEAGIGKSRLVAELRRELAGADCDVRIMQCQPRGNTRPLHSFLDYLQSAIHGADLSASRPDRAAIGAYLRAQGPDLDDGDADVLDFLFGGEPGGGQQWPAELTVDEIRHHAVASTLKVLTAWSSLRPQLVLIEDIHWADTLTRAVLARLAETVGSRPILVVGTSREDVPADIVGASNTHPIALARLGVEATADLLRSIWGSPLPTGLASFIFDKSDGVPLFAEELAHLLKERFGGTSSTVRDWSRALEDGRILTLEDLAAARLANLGELRRTAQVASVIGREFRIDLLSRIADADAAPVPLAVALEELVRARILWAAGSGEAASYRFRHVLIQEAAYNSLLKADRRELHKRIVQLIASEAVSLPPDEIVAWHYQQAGEAHEAARYAIQAAEACVARSAMQEADKLLSLAEEQLVLGAPDAGDADDLRLRLLATRGPVAADLFGRGARQTRAVYEQAVAFCQQRGDRDRAGWFPLYWGWWFTAPDFETQRARSEILVRDLEESADAEVRLQSLHCAWATNFHAGRHSYCLDCVRQGLALYDEERARLSRGRYGGHDARVCALGERALSLWFSGDGSGSAESIEAALGWAERIDHLGSTFHALDYAVGLRRCQNDYEGVIAVAERMAGIAADHGLPGGAAKAKLFQGWARALTGSLAAGRAEFEEGFALQREIGTEENLSVYNDMRAEILARAGQYDEAFAIVEETIATSTRTGQVFWLPELYRHGALLSHELGRSRERVVANLERAVALAEAQGAAALALRARETLEQIGAPRIAPPQ